MDSGIHERYTLGTQYIKVFQNNHLRLLTSLTQVTHILNHVKTDTRAAWEPAMPVRVDLCLCRFYFHISNMDVKIVKLSAVNKYVNQDDLI